MNTLRLHVEDEDHVAAQVANRAVSNDPAVRKAAEILQRGGLVAFPTETVYGLGANALDAEAVKTIFAAKERPFWDPIIVHVENAAMARRLVREWPQKAELLAKELLPGPLTLLLPRSDAIPLECTAGREKVGVRVPKHPVAQALLHASGLAIAAPSANRFGHTSPTTAAHVLADLDGRIDAVLDGGASYVGVESTVLDVTLETPVIYRPGGVTREQIESIIGPVKVAERVVSNSAPVESLESPGLGIRHYAPKAHVNLVYSEAELREYTEDKIRNNQRVGVMLPQGWRAGAFSGNRVVFQWGEFSDLEMLSRRLYQGFRWLDEQNVEFIVCPVPDHKGLGLAIYDRLLKAAAE